MNQIREGPDPSEFRHNGIETELNTKFDIKEELDNEFECQYNYSESEGLCRKEEPQSVLCKKEDTEGFNEIDIKYNVADTISSEASSYAAHCVLLPDSKNENQLRHTMAGASSSHNLASEEIIESLNETRGNNFRIFDSGSEFDTDESDEEIGAGYRNDNIGDSEDSDVSDGESDLQVKRLRKDTDWEWEKVDDSYMSQKFVFSERREIIKQVESVSEAFKLFFDQYILTKIAEETNRYANDYINSKQDNLTSRSRVHGWKNVDTDELYTYFALQILMGVIQKPTIKSYFNKNPVIDTPIFYKTMRQDRFELINRFLHFVDNSQLQSYEGNKKLFKINPIIKHLNEKYRTLYKMGENISLDESLTLWSGRQDIKKNLPLRAAKFGIKSYEICESTTGYLWQFVIYTGNTTEGDTDVMSIQVQKTTQIVVKLVEPLFGSALCKMEDTEELNEIDSKYFGTESNSTEANSDDEHCELLPDTKNENQDFHCNMNHQRLNLEEWMKANNIKITDQNNLENGKFGVHFKEASECDNIDSEKMHQIKEELNDSDEEQEMKCVDTNVMCLIKEEPGEIEYGPDEPNSGSDSNDEHSEYKSVLEPQVTFIKMENDTKDFEDLMETSNTSPVDEGKLESEDSILASGSENFNSTSKNDNSLTVSGKGFHRCKTCGMTFSSEFQLRQHRLVHKSDSVDNCFDCEICGRSFPTKAKIYRHMLIHRSERQVSCQFCSKTYLYRSELKKHMRFHTRDRPFPCNFCSKSFIESGHLKAHVRTHTGELPYSCNICSKSFSRNSGLVRHIRIHTGERPFSCNFCGKTFSHKNGLNKHVRIHTGERPYSCNVCSKTFIENSGLKYHMLTHTGEHPFSCKLCPKSFSCNVGLVRHMLTHTGERSFSCEICNVSFFHKSDLKKHSWTHSGTRPFSCEICNKSFPEKHKLMEHERTHTGERPFTCSVCNKSFSLNSNLTRHMRTHTDKSMEPSDSLK
ncbi:hypothetical protein C0J52_01450 [Blattella germanica]|nr:hypothetical protein C0J52_01450 [Blattella germanica]